MNIAVVGLWHLGTVTAACLASAGHRVCGLDFDAKVVEGLSEARPPVFEPGLEDLVREGLSAGRLQFTADARCAVSGADVVWVTYDTPVDEEDRADVEHVVQHVAALFPHLRDGSLVLISSQMPVGTTRRLEEAFCARADGRRVSFAYSPENLRLGKAIAVFTHPDRIVAGVRSQEDRGRLATMFRPFTERIEWMSVESAEMTKHAINAFLATSVAFINEIAALCEQVGADAGEVERGLKSEGRIGPKAYLSPGGAFAGGTLARDIVFLSQLGRRHAVPTHLLASVKESNDTHRQWAERRLEQILAGVAGKTIAIWGLTYKPGTDTLRRSNAVELCRSLIDRGARVKAYDPAVRSMPPDLSGIPLAENEMAAVTAAHALVVCTPWPAFRQVHAPGVASVMSRRLVLDANRFLADTLGRDGRIEYVSVGSGSRG